MNTLKPSQKEASEKNDLLLSPERIESAALKRILAEVVDERDLALIAHSYDRSHNRHNR